MRRAGTVLCLLAILAACTYLRTAFVLTAVYSGDHIRFLGNDPWYHMRVVDNLVAQWPHRLRLDPFAQIPGVGALEVAPLFDYLVAGTAMAVGGGHPDPSTVDRVGAWIPPLLAAVVCVLVFLLGRRLFGRGAGLTAAAWLAVMPGSFLRRSCLGFADHHVAEVLLSTLVILLFVKCLEPPPAGSRLGRVVLIVALGLAVAAYLLTWVGGVFLLVVLALCAYAVRVGRYARGRDDWDLSRVLGIGAVVAWGAMIPLIGYPMMREQVPPLLALGAGAVYLDASAKLSRRSSVPAALYPVLAAGLGLGLAWMVATLIPGSLGPTLGLIRHAAAGGDPRTVVEARPVTWAYAIPTFATALILAPLGLIAILVRFRPKTGDGRLVLVVWTLVVLAALLRQQRFAYYMAVPAALLSGFVVARAGRFAGNGVRRLFPQLGGGSRSRRHPASPWLAGTVAGLVGAALFYPNLAPAVIQASSPSGPDRGWYDALTWLRENTPLPLGRTDRYDARYLGGPGYHHPRSAYGVLAAWDRGYWITRIAHRIPNANPTQYGAVETSRYLTRGRPGRAANILHNLRTRYVILDDALPLRTTPSGNATGDLTSLAEWAGVSVHGWVQRYRIRTPTGSRFLVIYLPKYYRTMCVRLYAFDARAVTPSSSTVVVTYEEAAGTGSGTRTAISVKRFKTYEEALAYDATLPGTNHVLGGTDPTKSCIPLAALRAYSLVYETPDSGDHRAHVKIFEFADRRSPAR